MTMESQIAKRLAKAVNRKAPQKRTDAEGTVMIVNGEPRVLLPGAEEPIPCRSTVTLNEGDRVTVRIEDHRATVTGNMTNRAVDGAKLERELKSISGASNYVEETPDGLVVGDRGPSGAYKGWQLLVGNDAFSLLNELGKRAAYFGASEWLGDDAATLDVFSGIGCVRIRASNTDELPEGIAGGSMRVFPPEVTIRDRVLDDDGEEVAPASITLTVEYQPENTEPGYKKRTSVTVDPDGVHIEGDLYVNGKKIA